LKNIERAEPSIYKRGIEDIAQSNGLNFFIDFNYNTSLEVYYR